VRALRGWIVEVVPPGAALLIGGAVWEAFVRLTRVPDYLLPAPTTVALQFTRIFGLLVSNAAITLTEALAGLALGALFGLGLAVLMLRSRFVEEAIYPVAVTLRSTPFVAVAPILVIWFGFSLLTKAIVSAHSTFFVFLVNAIVGLRSVEPSALEFFRSVDASEREIFWHLRVPNALPYLFAAFRLSVSLSLIGAIVGELAGAQAGLGYFIETAAINLRTSYVFSGVIVLTVMGIVLSEAVSTLESRVLTWHESQRVDR
jgi:NitT/TauT family transport system permease protein